MFLTHTHAWTDADGYTDENSHGRNANKHQPVCSCWWQFTSLVFTVTPPRSLTHKCKVTYKPCLHSTVFDLTLDARNSVHSFQI